jgi:hypothetical protein
LRPEGRPRTLRGALYGSQRRPRAASAVVPLRGQAAAAGNSSRVGPGGAGRKPEQLALLEYLAPLFKIMIFAVVAGSSVR